MAYDQTQPIAPALNPGDKLGYFEVGNPLAAGGMSLVWKGYDKLLNRHVAIKQIAAGSAADEPMRERFRKEAEIQKRVSASHKNLVQVIDFIDEPRGLFIVMEYVDGSSLDTVLAKLEGPMEPKQALGIVHQIAVALVTVHGAGVLHRDLKPSNILLPREGGVKLCDFGLAAVADEQDVLTLGTARYMAPELFTGQPADARCDLYSLGMIAYEMLAGRPAFEETFKTVLRDQRNQALRWMKWHTNLRLAAPPLISLNPAIPTELSELVARMMAKDATQRIPTAAALIDVMKRLFTGRPAQAAAVPQAPSPQALQAAADPTAPLPQKSRIPLILAAVLGVQLLALAVWFGYSSIQTSRTTADAHRQATEQFQEGQKLYKNEQYADAEQLFQTLADQWPNDPQLGAPSKSRVLICQAQQLMLQGVEFNKSFQFGQAADCFSKVRDLLDQAENTGGISLTLIKDLREEAQNSDSFSRPAQNIMDLTARGEFNAARQKIRQLKETQTRRSDTEDKLLAELAERVEGQADRAQLDLVLVRAKQLVSDGRPDQALNALNDALAHHNSAELRDMVRQVTASMEYDKAISAARTAEDAGDLVRARMQYRRAANMRPSKELTDKDTELRSKIAYQEGRSLEREGRLDEAGPKYAESNSILPNEPAQRAIENLKGTVSKQTYIQTGDAAMTAGDFATAITVYKKAMELSADAATQAKINQATIRMKVADARSAMDRGDLKRTDSLLAEALQLDPTDAPANRLKAELNVRTEYQALLEKGDDARKRSLFGEATTAYIAARNKLKGTSIPTDEINQLINDTEFDSWIAKAKAAIEAGQWSQARAFLRSAGGMRNNDTVRKLMTEVDRNDPENAK